MMKFMQKKMNKKGFTLIELIVVIAVLGILVLLAAPRFLGYTRDAQTAAMKADAKILSNAALVYYIDGEVKETGTQTWPATTTPVTAFTVSPVDAEGVATVAEDDITISGFEIDVTATGLDSSYIKNLKNPVEDYVIVTSGDNAGEVYHKTGIKDRAELTWYGVDLKGTVEE